MQTRVHKLHETSFCYVKEDIENAGLNHGVAICTYHAKLRLIGFHPTPRPISIPHYITPDLLHHHPLQTGIAGVIDNVNFGGPDVETCSTNVLNQRDIIFHLTHCQRVIKVSGIEFYYSCCTNSCLGVFRDSKMLEKSEKSENRKKSVSPHSFSVYLINSCFFHPKLL